MEIVEFSLGKMEENSTEPPQKKALLNESVVAVTLKHNPEGSNKLIIYICKLGSKPVTMCFINSTSSSQKQKKKSATTH